MGSVITPEDVTPELRAALAALDLVTAEAEAATVSYSVAASRDKRAALDDFMRVYGEWLKCSMRVDECRKAILLEKIRKAGLIKDFTQWARYPVLVVTLLLWLLLIPPAWLCVKIGNAGHALAGWCGFESREW